MDRATRGVRVHWVGAKPPPRAIAAGGRLGSSASSASQEAPDPRKLDSAVSELPCSRGDGRREIRGPTGRSDGRRKPEVRHHGGYRRSAGRACGSIRWQKSTNDAWSSAPRREERRGRRWSSSSPLQKRGSRQRRSVGSRARVAKPCARWRVRVRDSTRKRGVERAFVDGRRPGALDPRSLTGLGGRTCPAVDQHLGADSSSTGRQR